MPGYGGAVEKFGGLLIRGSDVRILPGGLTWGTVPDEAEARLRAGDALLAEGRRAEAGEQFERALLFYCAVGATSMPVSESWPFR